MTDEEILQCHIVKKYIGSLSMMKICFILMRLYYVDLLRRRTLDRTSPDIGEWIERWVDLAKKEIGDE